MGIGDEIIASGHARKLFEATGKRVLICDARGAARWSGMWQGLDWIAHPHHFKMPDVLRLANGPRCRPYIDYRKGFTRARGMHYSGWRVRDNMGSINLSAEELAFGEKAARELGRFVVVEPLVKAAANPNKQWGRGKWHELASLLHAERMNPVQLGPAGTATLPGIPHYTTPDFRFGVAVMKFARWNFLPDGGLHHAAAVLGMPATVMWGGTNDPDILGYPDHENIFFPSVCGKWTPCSHCRAIWSWIKAPYVWERTLARLVERYGEDFRSR